MTPSWDADDQRTVAYFSELNGKFGVDARALDWGSRESQQLRFKVLSEVRMPASASILDVGCGQGDLYLWLQREGRDVTYTGIDLTPSMVASAQSRFPSVRFECGNLLDPAILAGETFDVVIASGIFYYRQHSPEQYMSRMVSALFSRCRSSLAFNSLSSWATNQSEGEFYADPAATVTCCRELTHQVVLRHDYHPQDFTIFLYR